MVRCQERLGGLLKYYHREAASGCGNSSRWILRGGISLAGASSPETTVQGQWLWWRVPLPLWVVLGHNALYITVGFAWLFFADDGAAEEEVTIRQDEGHRVTNRQRCCV